MLDSVGLRGCLMGVTAPIQRLHYKLSIYYVEKKFNAILMLPFCLELIFNFSIYFVN